MGKLLYLKGCLKLKHISALGSSLLKAHSKVQPVAKLNKVESEFSSCIIFTIPN